MWQKSEVGGTQSIIESTALSICQFINSPVLDGSVHLITSYCIACFDIARLTVIVQGINGGGGIEKSHPCKLG